MQDSELYTKVMFGENSKHVPCWMYMQPQAGGVISFVGATMSPQLWWGGNKTHQYMLGELIARPHFVVGSNTFRGTGLAGLVSRNPMDFIMAEDMNILCDPAQKVGRLMREYSIRVEEMIRK